MRKRQLRQLTDMVERHYEAQMVAPPGSSMDTVGVLTRPCPKVQSSESLITASLRLARLRTEGLISKEEFSTLIVMYSQSWQPLRSVPSR